MIVAILYFCGIKHSGKTSLGRLVAQQYGYRFVDSDDLVLQDKNAYSTIREFYRTEGKDAFMLQEVTSLQAYLDKGEQDVIISLGGGACDNAPLISLMKDTGTVIYLKVEEKILLSRILKGGVPPFLDPDNVEASFASLYTKRDALYRTFADIMVELLPYKDIRDTARYLYSVLSEELLHGS